MRAAYIAKGEIRKLNPTPYRKALDRESVFPKLKTDAYILYPLLIIENKLINLYQSANKVLDEHQERVNVSS